MKSGKYLPSGKKPTNKEPMVREAKARTYGHQKTQKSSTWAGLNIASVKRRLKKPVKRSSRDIAWALKIAGIGEGPPDLSENTREYLYSDK